MGRNTATGLLVALLLSAGGLDAGGQQEPLSAKAEAGDAKAQALLGLMCHQGRGAPQDDAKAVAWWSKAAAQGHAPAQFNLGAMYYQGKGIPQDYARAVDWWTRAAEQGHAPAQFNLGVMCYHGKGVPQDLKKALEWQAKAAEGAHDLPAQVRRYVLRWDKRPPDPRDDRGAAKILGVRP